MTAERKLRLAKAYAVCHPRFIQRFRYWQNITLDGHDARWVDDVVACRREPTITMHRGNTTPR
jgi:hypothetical protein